MMKIYSPIKLLIGACIWLATLLLVREKPTITDSRVGWSSPKGDYRAWYNIKTGWVGVSTPRQHTEFEPLDFKSKIMTLQVYENVLEQVTDQYIKAYLGDEDDTRNSKPRN